MNKYIHPFTEIVIPLTDDPIEDKNGDPRKDKDGNIEYLKRSSCTLANLIERVKAAGIPESEYKNVEVFGFTYPRCSDPYLDCIYNKPKTQEQLEKEKQQLLKEEEKQKTAKEERKKLREAKKAEKEKVLASLTAEQKKVLGIKESPTPGYAGRDETGGSDF